MSRSPTTLLRAASLFVVVSFFLERDVIGATIHVTVSDSGGAPDSRLTDALAAALTDAGLPAAASDCLKGCVRVAVRHTEPRHFLVQVQTGGTVAQTPLELDASASPFDVAHALAIEVEMLTDRTREIKPRRRRLLAEASTAGSAPVASSGSPSVTPSGSEPRSVDAPVQAPRSEPASIHDVAAPPVPTPEARFALSIGATTVAGTSGDLWLHGLALGVRVPITPRVDIRTAFALLRPQRTMEGGVPSVREVLPLQVWTTRVLPHLPSLRAGAGLEAFYLTVDERASTWSMGVLGQLEARHSIRGVQLLAMGQAAYHPSAWQRGVYSTGAFTVPHWTLAASLGLEFRLF